LVEGFDEREELIRSLELVDVRSLEDPTRVRILHDTTGSSKPLGKASIDVFVLYQRPWLSVKNRWHDTASQMTQKSSQPPPLRVMMAGVAAKKGAGRVHAVGFAGSSLVEYIGGPD